MSKIYPFKHHHLSPGIRPMSESLWFQTYQRLLLRIVNSSEGQDLLLIDKRFNDIPIIEVGASYINGHLGFDGKDHHLTGDFRTAPKWGNLIRYRWPEFVKLAKQFYEDKENNLTLIEIDGNRRWAAASDTYFPDPGTSGPDSVDGTVLQDYGTGNGVAWSTIRNKASGTSAAPSSAQATVVDMIADNVSNEFKALKRGFFLYKNNIAGGSTINSATVSLRGRAKSDGLSATPDINIFASNPATNTDLVTADFDAISRTPFSTAVTFAGFSTAGYNAFALNASGLAAIPPGGVAKFSAQNENYDVDNVAPAWTSLARSLFTIDFVEQAGTANDPKLDVDWTEVTGGNTTLLLMGVG